jgi:hydroxymethylpyrimidine pyrophosphatase-like HAD family hydrolase
MELKNKIIYFSDLDDTIFQTKRKSGEGIYQATQTKNPEKVSYYTKEQKEFLDHIILDPKVILIPVTARTKDQFQRTLLYKQNLTPFYSNYYGGSIYHNYKQLQDYDLKIRPTLTRAQKETILLISKAENKLKKSLCSVNVDGYYFVIDILEKDEYIYIKELFASSEVSFNLYQNEKTITILPSVINKKEAVRYFCDLLEPKLTIGLGDSASDLEFLNFCDFKIISKIGELNQKINAEAPSLFHKII